MSEVPRGITSAFHPLQTRNSLKRVVSQRQAVPERGEEVSQRLTRFGYRSGCGVLASVHHRSGKRMPESEATHSVARHRRRERRPVVMVGYIILQSGSRHMVELFDLNYGGCGIRASIPLLPGDRVKLTVHERGSIPAEVRWCKDGRAGLDFSPSEEPREPVAQRHRAFHSRRKQ